MNLHCAPNCGAQGRVCGGRHLPVCALATVPCVDRAGLELFFAQTFARARPPCRHPARTSGTRGKPKAQGWSVCICMITLDDLRLEQVPESLRGLALAGQREADLAEAARQLTRLRHEAKERPPRIYTGRVFGRRACRGAKVILPNGHIGTLFRTVRGVAVVTFRDESALRLDQHVAVSTEELQPFRLPAAAILGSAKRGVREIKSARKGRASAINGAAPPGPGSRQRGRPRKQAPPSSVNQPNGSFPSGQG